MEPFYQKYSAVTTGTGIHPYQLILMSLIPETEIQLHQSPGAAALGNWNEKLDGERTFPANDSRKVRQRLARANAAAFVVAHSTLTPPPAEPIVQEPENK